MTAREGRLQRARRSARAFVRLPGTRSFVVLLVVFAIVLVVAVVVMDLRYGVGAEEGNELDLGEAVYAVFALLFFGGGYPWPDDLITRVFFFLVPILGIAVLSQGVVRLGTVILNRERWERAMASTSSDHVIVCGLGRVQYRVIEWLLELDQPVVVIEKDGTHEFLDAVRSWGVPVIVGDARRVEVLRDAAIERAGAIATISSDDLLNLSVATAARSLRPGIRVVMRTFDDRLADNLRTGFDIYAAYSASSLAAPALAAAATMAPVDQAFTVGHGESREVLAVTEFTITADCGLVGATITAMEEEHHVAAVALRRGGVPVRPGADEALQVGDEVTLCAPIEPLKQLARTVPPTRELPRYQRAAAPGE